MSQPACDTYIYQPLNPLKRQVRILRLAPGIFGQLIRGSLITISLDKLPRRRWQQLREWHALSYVWGSSDRDEYIRITRKKVRITKTLHRALQYLRWQRDERHLWIDQICTNQDDIKERSSQVQLMRDIYSGATSVLAWLGEDKPDTDALLCMISQTKDIINVSHMLRRARKDAIQTLRAVLDEAACDLPPEERTRWTNAIQIHIAELEELRMLLKVSEETPNMYLRERFADFFRNAWFSRVWTLQEAVLAKHLVLLSGWSRATLEEVESALWNFQMSFEFDASSLHLGQFEFVGIMRLRLWHEQLQDRSGQEASAADKSGGSRTLERTLIDRKASNPRDYVYGQLGLFNL